MQSRPPVARQRSSRLVSPFFRPPYVAFFIQLHGSQCVAKARVRPSMLELLLAMRSRWVFRSHWSWHDGSILSRFFEFRIPLLRKVVFGLCFFPLLAKHFMQSLNLLRSRRNRFLRVAWRQKVAFVRWRVEWQRVICFWQSIGKCLLSLLQILR